VLLWSAFFVFTSYQFSVEAVDKIVVGQTDSIEFDKLYEAILAEAGIDYEVLLVPTARKRRMFVEGKIVIDCCAAVAWRKRPEEIAVQLHSKVFLHSAEHYFFHRDSDADIKTIQDLKRHRLAIVRGFTYKHEQTFGETLKTTSIDEMMTVVALGRAQVGIINPYDFQRRLAKTPRPLRLGIQHEASPLTIRVHKKKANLLPRINAAIDRFLADGTIEKMQSRVHVPQLQ